MRIDTTPFRRKYQIDDEGKFGHYKSGHCAVCGNDTSQVDASLLWDGLVTYLCSDRCHDAFWGNPSY